jgi:hypothetical protein
MTQLTFSVCPSCKTGDHRHHQYDYKNHDGVVRLCRCQVCTAPKPTERDIIQYYRRKAGARS